MQPPRSKGSGGGGVTTYGGVTRSMTRRQQRNSLPVPDDLAMEIFSRLPSKAIARCRCASKLFSSMLRSQDFTDSFLTRSCARPQLLFVREDHSVAGGVLTFISSPQPVNPQENSYVVASNPLACFPRSSGFYGCTNGFFCYGADQFFKGLIKPVEVPVICNPSTGQSLTMPRLISKKKDGVQSFLGYEPMEKEFKVLSMNTSRVSNKWISVEHQVLTLGTKKLSWRLVECCIPHLISSKWICISGVLYYAAGSSVELSMVVCFDLRSEKFSSVKFGKAMPGSTTLVNYGGKLGLLMSGDSRDNVSRSSTSFELWVLLDAAKHEWSKHVYVLPPSWEVVVAEATMGITETTMCIAGMVGTNEIVLSPCYQNVPYYLIYFNVERKTITQVGIQGLEAFQGKSFHTYLNYVQNVKLL